MDKCLVIGGAGFLGSTLCNALSGKGFEVSAFDLFEKKPLLALPEAVEKIKGNILSEKQLAKAISGEDFVFHFAFSSIPSTSLLNPGKELPQNIAPSKKIIEICAKEGVKKIVFPSSGTVYGKWFGKPFTESDATEPQSPYAASKLEIEKFLQRFQDKGLNFAILRPGSAFGPGQNSFSGAGAATTFLYNALHGLPIKIFGNGSVKRDYTYSEDISFCAIKAIEKSGCFTLNVSSNIGTSTKALAEKCIEISGKKTRIEFLDARQSDLDSIILDNSLAMKKLGFSPTPLEIGLEKTMKWLNENF